MLILIERFTHSSGQGSVNNSSTQAVAQRLNAAVCQYRRDLLSQSSLLPDDEGHVDGAVDLERGDVLDHGGGAVDVDHSLVDLHLESVPGVGSLTAGGLSGGHAEVLGGDSNGSLGLVAEVLGSFNDLIATPLERPGLAALEGHSGGKRAKLT